MKKLTEHRRVWLQRRGIKRMRRRRMDADRRYRMVQIAKRAQATYFRIRYEIGERSGTGWAKSRSPMPAQLCLEDNYEETAQCIANIRDQLIAGQAMDERRRRSGQAPFRILPHYNDFTTIQRCSPATALVLAAEFDKSRHLRKWNIPLIDSNRWKPEFVAMLDEIGFFRLLDIPRPPQEVPQRTSQTMQFQSGALVARNEAADITDAMRSLLLNSDPILRNDRQFESSLMQLLGAIQEATENSCDHAYRNTDIPDVNKRWWTTGTIDVAQKHVNLLVYDQGRSIPDTLPEWKQYPFVQSRLARFSRRLGQVLGANDEDAIKIRLAMDAPRSSTLATHRGKGFVLFKTVVDQSKAARLRILSRNGEFIYETDKRPKVKALATPLRGTLVEWDLWL